MWCPGAWYDAPSVGVDGTVRTGFDQPLGPALGSPRPTTGAGLPPTLFRAVFTR